VRRPAAGETWYLAGALLALAALTGVCEAWLGLRNPTVVGLSYLMIVLLAAAASTLRVAVATSVVAVLALNFFFLPPVGTFRLDDPENWVALLVFLVVSYVGSRLSVMARERAALVEERREADRMRQSAELKSALLSSLGHDLKTPLTAIAVAADNLRTNWSDDDQRREQLGIVASEVARLNRLFQNIVDMARIETGAVAPASEWVSPEDLVDAAVQQVQHSLAGHPLELQIDSAIAACVDPRLTSAALAHVLENAGAYTAAGTPITISARSTNGGLELSVRDTGPGIPAEELDSLFEHYYRGSHARRSVFGTGMGLAITRGLIEAQGGRVAAGNRPEGGALFTMTIPAALRAADTGERDGP
jgi:two-component system sensor histidine kinase KdpD